MWGNISKASWWNWGQQQPIVERVKKRPKCGWKAANTYNSVKKQGNLTALNSFP